MWWPKRKHFVDGPMVCLKINNCRRHERRRAGRADATQKNGAKSIIGGGDSVKALNQAKLGDK